MSQEHFSETRKPTMEPASKRVLATIVVLLVAATTCGAFAYHFPFHKVLIGPSQDPGSEEVIEYGQYGAQSISQFFRIIKNMVVEFNTTNGNVTSWQIISFSSKLAVMNDNTVAYLVNMTGAEHTGNLSDQDCVQVWIDPSTSYIKLVTMGQKEWTGPDAQQENGILTFLTTAEWLSLLNSTTVMPTAVNRTTSIGSTQLLASTYHGLNSLRSYQNLVVTVGSLPPTGMQIVISIDYIVPGSGLYSFRVLSLELNQ